VAAVELINILRPATAISWFVAYAAHALHRWPEWRQRLADPGIGTAFAHELRRWYPFVPFLGALARRDQDFAGVPVESGGLVLLDVYGQHHDAHWWDEPAEFRPERFADRVIDPFTLIPQGGGDTRTGHRCPGEDLTVEILRTLAPRLARMRYRVPAQDLGISLRRIPAHVAGGFVVDDVSAAVA
jgi:fatty-acid peroxygenase